jgi:cytochrome c-type biogenesis protein CcmH
MRCAALALVALCLGQPAIASPEKLSNPVQEARAAELQKEFRCLVCQGESLDESEAPLAADLRRLIRERIVAGDSNAAVEHYLVARYGDFILMKPPVRRETYALWFGPLVLILLGGAAVAVIALRAHGRLHTLSSEMRDNLPVRNAENS